VIGSEHLEQAVCRAVADHLKAELGRRGLVLTPDREAAATADAAQRGRRLLSSAVGVCYPDDDLAVEFEGEDVARRLQGALAFGAATAALLSDRRTDEVDLLCALFTLGVGLVDSLCDGDPDAGTRVLGLVQERDVAKAAEELRRRGWLRRAVVPALALDPTVAFTVDVIEAFFEMLHAVYAGDEWWPLRRDVGAQLEAALEAERRSVEWSAGPASRQELIECSRRTSVLPFEIVQTLVGGAEPAAATLLGEAVWRIDDLVDLCQDARTGALNAVLLGTTLERLVETEDIAGVAAEAAERLSAGLALAPGADAADRFLLFVQWYAGP
jgi:hypothetical protein